MCSSINKDIKHMQYEMSCGCSCPARASEDKKQKYRTVEYVSCFCRTPSTNIDLIMLACVYLQMPKINLRLYDLGGKGRANKQDLI
uniref:Uncharacterized protein n=1 Tax=Pyxicephalus adspersus TaxID=30357 RepID=A0AAV2ZXV2_PYXAD|nr:TPA: hypothetical protein GDO54_003725 [Pyxicephalus adspersus]